MKKSFLLTSIIVASLISGCRTITQNYNITYNPKPCERGVTQPGKSLFVAEIIDERITDEKITFDQNNPAILIPLWPYSYAEVNPIVKYSYFQAGLTDSLSKLVSKNLSASELFKDIHIAQIDDNPPLEPTKESYQLILRLKQAVWKRSLTSYGLSYAGVYLWFFLPKSYGSVVLTLEGTLREPETNRIVANEIFSHEVSATEWIYDQMNYQPSISTFALEESFPEIMKSIREMLLKTLKDKINDQKKPSIQK